MKYKIKLTYKEIYMLNNIEAESEEAAIEEAKRLVNDGEKEDYDDRFVDESEVIE